MKYVLEREKIESFVKKVKPSKVLVEAPPGLLKLASEVCKELRVDCEVSATPVFGSCLVFEFLPADAIIHLGHNPYPWWKPKKPTLFLDVPGELEVNFEALKDLLKGRKVVLGATVQHLNLLRLLKEKMKEWGFEPLTFSSRGLEEGQVLGCDYRNLRKGFDDYVIVAGGEFHALGAAMYLKRDVLSFDPFTSRAKRIDPKRPLARRMWLVSEASKRGSVAFVDGIEGQARGAMIRGLKALAERKGIKVKVYRSVILTREFVLNLPEDVVVVFSCPRMPLDDFGDVEEKLILSPGEFRAALLGLQNYTFPF